MIWRQERQLGFLWGSVAVGLIALSPWGSRLVEQMPACHFRDLLGFPCPTCGASRTALALAEFDVLGAFVISPLMTLAWVFLVVGGLVTGTAALLRKPVPVPSRPPGWIVRLLLVAAVLLNWGYLVLRLP